MHWSAIGYPEEPAEDPDLDNDPSAVWDLSKDNYLSAVQHGGHLRRHLEEEVKMGLMEKDDRQGL